MANAPAPSSGRARLALFLAFLLMLPAVTARLNASDEIEFFAWLRSWVFDRDVDFENEYRYFHDLAPEKHVGLRETFIEGTNEAGRRPNFAPVGSAILWAPFYAAGHLAAVVTGAPRDGFSRPYLAAIAYGSAVYGLVALLLAVDLARRLLGRTPATPAFVVWFGTPLLFYMYVAPGFSHACSAFAVTLFLWTWLRVREDWSLPGVAMLGLVGGLLPMVREQDAFFLIAPALDFARWLISRTPSFQAAATRAAVGLVTCALAYLPQLLAYQALNGHPSPTTLVARKMSWTSPHFWGVIVSPNHGLFFWTPLALVALAGLAWFTVRRRVGAHRDGPWLGALLLLLFVLQIYISGCVESWTVAGSFGQRRFLAMTPLLVVGLAALVPPTGLRGARRALAAAVVVFGIWWNLGLMAQFGLHLMDRQRLTLADNVRLTFLELPRMAPAIAWRYFTDRESFFGVPRQR